MYMVLLLENDSIFFLPPSFFLRVEAAKWCHVSRSSGFIEVVLLWDSFFHHLEVEAKFFFFFFFLLFLSFFFLRVLSFYLCLCVECGHQESIRGDAYVVF